MKKSKIFYNLFNILVLVVPTSLYLFLSATIFNLNPTHEIFVGNNPNIEYLQDRDDSWFVYDFDSNVVYKGVVEWSSDARRYGVRLFEGQTIKIGKEYKAVEMNVETKKLELVDIKKFALSKKEGVNLPISVIISIIGFVIAGLVVGGKMGWIKRRKRLATWLSLFVITGVLFLINMVVTNILNVFMIFFVSWSIYCIGYLVKNGNVAESNADKIVGLLKEL